MRAGGVEGSETSSGGEGEAAAATAAAGRLVLLLCLLLLVLVLGLEVVSCGDGDGCWARKASHLLLRAVGRRREDQSWAVAEAALEFLTE